MLNIVILSLIFSLVTATSIVLLGSREFVEGPMSLTRLFHILFHWKFILGAIFAFAARLLFVVTNSAINKVDYLSHSSTTITSLINVSAIILIVIFNYYFLHERLNAAQGVGSLLVLVGIFILLFK